MYFSPKIAALLATLLTASVNAAPAPAVDIMEVNEFNASANALDTRNSGTGQATGCTTVPICNPYTGDDEDWNFCCIVKLTCWAIADGTKTQGILDLRHNVKDNHTPWLYAPGEATTDWECRKYDYQVTTRQETEKA